MLLVVALVPPIRAGSGLNFGLPVGVCCGLLGSVIAIQTGLGGMSAFALALGASVPLAVAAGAGQAWLLERVKGQEMMVGTYIGFAAVALMCMVWLLAPFDNPEMVWALGGKGLRTTVSLTSSFGRVLDGAMPLRLGPLVIPTGLIVFVATVCWASSFYLRSSAGLRMAGTGQNPLFARSCGIDVVCERRNATIMSTVLAATGICVYAQSLGFLQLYLAPLMMAFPAVAGILIGGASIRQAQVSNAVIGSVLLQTLLTCALPVTQQLVHGNISEVARVLLSNGMILYALTRSHAR
jgi:simple sugar transport system permease protein